MTSHLLFSNLTQLSIKSNARCGSLIVHCSFFNLTKNFILDLKDLSQKFDKILNNKIDTRHQKYYLTHWHSVSCSWDGCDDGVTFNFCKRLRFNLGRPANSHSNKKLGFLDIFQLALYARKDFHSTLSSTGIASIIRKFVTK